MSEQTPIEPEDIKSPPNTAKAPSHQPVEDKNDDDDKVESKPKSHKHK